MFNNKTKTFLLLTLIFVTLLGVSAATAATIDNNATDTTGNTQDTMTQAADTAGDNSIPTTTVSNKEINKNTQNNIKTEGEGTFDDLYNDIKDTSEVTLTKDYKHVSGDYGLISINEDKTIDGAGHTINGGDINIFTITADNTLTLKNMKITAEGERMNHAIIANGNLVCENVVFDFENTTISNAWAMIYVYTNNVNVSLTGTTLQNYNSMGGVYYAYRTANLMMDDCTVKNITGRTNGVIRIHNAKSTGIIKNSRFINNIEDSKPVIDVNNRNNNLEIDNCYFEGNYATSNGAVIRTIGNLTVSNSEFLNNKVEGTSNNAYGTIFVNNGYACINLEGNTMDDPDVPGAEIYVFTGNISSPVITGQDVTANAGEEVTITYTMTDDSGNSIMYKDATYSITVNEETYSASYERGVISKTITAPATDGTYPVSLTYNNVRIVDDNDVILTDAVLTVGNVAPDLIITDATYSNFFDADGNIIEGAIPEGSIAKFDGTFTNRNFNINIPMTIDTGSNPAVFDTCTFKITNDVTVKNVKFTGGSASTAVMDLTGNLVLENVDFEDVTAQYSQIINVRADSSVTVINCTVDNFKGGAFIRPQGTSTNRIVLKVTDSSFTNNNATFTLFNINSQYWNVTIENSNFTDNFGQNGGVFSTNRNNNNISITGCNFTSNTGSGKAGAIYIAGTNTNISIVDSYFTQNQVKSTSSNPASTTLAGVLCVGSADNIVYLSNNVMEDNLSPYTNADIYFEYPGIIVSPVKITPHDASAIQYEDADITVDLTDDMGNTIAYKNGFEYIVSISEDELFRGNYSKTETITANYEPGNYTIMIDYDDTVISDITVAPATLEVIKSDKLQYAAVQALIDEDTTGTVTLDAEVRRGDEEESIVINKDMVIDGDGHTIDATQGRVFNITNGATVTIKNVVITNVGNEAIANENVEGRLANLTKGTSLTLENVLFANNTAPSNYNAASGSFILAFAKNVADEEQIIINMNNCTVTNTTGTFINAIDNVVMTIDGTKFVENKLGSTYNSIIANGGKLTLTNSEFINNTANFAMINGQSQGLPMFVYGDSYLTYNKPLTVTNTTFIDNYASAGKGAAINTNNDTKVTDSVFIRNRQNAFSNRGGAIRSDAGLLEIENSIFVNNSAKDNHGSAISNEAGDLTITNSIIISNVAGVSSVYNYDEEAIVDADGNYWGKNDITGLYNGFTVSEWRIFNVTVDSEDPISLGDTVPVKATLMQGTDGTDIFDYLDTLPDYGAVSFSSRSGTLSEETVDMVNGEATTSFTVDNSPFTITATYPNEEVTYHGEANIPGPKVYTLNDGNWTEYFNEADGTVLSWIEPNSEFRFEGVFNNRYMVIAAPFNLTTADEQAVFNNCQLVITGYDVNVTNIQMNGVDIEEPLISVENALTTRIENNTITLTNNEDKAITHAIELSRGKDNVIRNNTITTTGPEDNIVYTTSGNNIITIYTTSIYAFKSEGLIIDSNKITTKANSQPAEQMGTIYGIYVVGEYEEWYDEEWEEYDNYPIPVSDIQIINNEIITESNVYAYGITTNHLKDSLIENNTVTTTSNNYADGIQGILYDTTINNNTVKANGKELSYGIIVAGFMDYNSYDVVLVENNKVTNNIVEIKDTNNAWGIEVYIANNNTVKYNNITISASNGVGVGLGDSDRATVSYNNINLTATMETPSNNGDTITSYPAGVKICPTLSQVKSSYNNTVTFNNITVTAPVNEVPAVNSSTRMNTITDNYLVAPCGKGDNAVVNTDATGTIENNTPVELIITDENYANFFEDTLLKAKYNNTDLIVSGDFTENTMFVFDGINATITNDGTAVFHNGQIMTGNGATMVFDGLIFENNVDPFILESAGNVINNTKITINSEDPIHAIDVYGEGNTIANTLLNITAPSGDVEYGPAPDYKTVAPAPAAIVVRSDNNLIDNVTVYFDGTESTGYFPTVNAIYVVSSDTIINNNTIKDSKVNVKGSNYVYGINVGKAKDTTIENVDVEVNSAYYADAIQLFDADTISITGTVKATADTEAYGVYSTAMGSGFSDNIDLTGLNVEVEAAKATGVLLEGTRNAVIADATYTITGENATAISSYVDFMGNIPSNISITGLDITINTTGNANILYFGNATDITITGNTINANQGSEINFNATPNSKVVDNFILIGEKSDLKCGDLAVITTEDDTTIEDNRPVPSLADILKKLKELEEQVNEQQETIDELNNTVGELNETVANQTEQIAALNETVANQTEQINDLNNTVAELNETVAQQQETIDALNDTVAGQQETIDALNETVAQQQAEIDDLTNELNKANEQISALNDTIAGQQAEIDDLTNELNKANEQISALNDTVAEQQETIDALNDTVAGQQETIDALNDTVAGQQETIGALNDTVADKQETIDALNDTVAQQEKTIADLQAKLEELQKQIEELTKPSETTLTITPIEDAQYGDAVLITGTLTDDEGKAVPGTINLNINGENVTVEADTTGTYQYEYTFTKLGENTITATYDGTEKYTPSNANITVEVEEQDTAIIFDEIASITSGEKAKITGQLVDANGNGLYGTVKLLINNGRATVKTDSEGKFTYEATLSKVGVNNITASYLGSTRYNPSNATTTVDVTAIETSIELDEIAPIKSGESITISGKLVDANGNPVVGTIKLLINNGKATVKTDSNGVFTYDYTLSKVGTNNITVSYLGANRYTASEATTTVTVGALNTKLTIDPVTAKKGDKITITGKLVDENGNPVVGTVKLLINGGRATVKTDENGVFSYEYTVTKVGANNITATYEGSNRYTVSTATSTIDVAKAGTQITLNPLGTVTQKSLVDITGQLSDENGNGIYGTVKLLINNGRATVKTDKTGAFTYSYNATRAGDNTIKASYLVSNNYEASEATTNFTVVKA